MADTTPYLGLTKPAISNFMLISDFNTNMDLLDTSAQTTQANIDQLNTDVANAVASPYVEVNGQNPTGVTSFTVAPTLSRLRYKSIGKTVFGSYSFVVPSPGMVVDGTGLKYALPWDLYSIPSNAGSQDKAIGPCSAYFKNSGNTWFVYSGVTLLRVANDAQPSKILFLLNAPVISSSNPATALLGSTSGTAANWRYNDLVEVYSNFIVEVP